MAFGISSIDALIEIIKNIEIAIAYFLFSIFFTLLSPNNCFKLSKRHFLLLPNKYRINTPYKLVAKNVILRNSMDF